MVLAQFGLPDIDQTAFHMGVKRMKVRPNGFGTTRIAQPHRRVKARIALKAFEGVKGGQCAGTNLGSKRIGIANARDHRLVHQLHTELRHGLVDDRGGMQDDLPHDAGRTEKAVVRRSVVMGALASRNRHPQTPPSRRTSHQFFFGKNEVFRGTLCNLFGHLKIL